MKFHVEIINDVQSGSRDAVHPYCMFESLDSVDNMWEIFEYYRKVLIDIEKSDFTLDNGMKVKVFLGGDYHFLSDMLGHQGQASTFPSPLDLVVHLEGQPPICAMEKTRNFYSTHPKNTRGTTNI